MNALAALAVLLTIAAGVAGVVLGEGDDSPGLQLLGALLVVGALFVAVRARRRAAKR